MSSFSERPATIESSSCNFYHMLQKIADARRAVKSIPHAAMQTAEAGLERTIGVPVWKLTPSVLLTRIETMRCWLVQEVCVTPTRQEY
jgi:hypothetical protein